MLLLWPIHIHVFQYITQSCKHVYCIAGHYGDRVFYIWHLFVCDIYEYYANILLYVCVREWYSAALLSYCNIVGAWQFKHTAILPVRHEFLCVRMYSKYIWWRSWAYSVLMDFIFSFFVSTELFFVGFALFLSLW